MSKLEWFRIEEEENIISPSLLVYPDRIHRNIKLMIEIAGGTDKLRPHIKTHKIAEIIKMQQLCGIQKYKCATIAEAELLGLCEAEDILLAMQPVGSQVKRFFELIKKFPKSKFSTIIDNPITLKKISSISKEKGLNIGLWLDVNNGMDRTGIQPNRSAELLFIQMSEDSSIIAKGFHVYDGHIHKSCFEERKQVCDADFELVLTLKLRIEAKGIKVKTIVIGGTPTFPIHKNRKGVELSPGTSLLWDVGYANNYKDLKFEIAAVILTRVVSKPTHKLVCFDLGHKAVASEMSLPRVDILGFELSKQMSQSEEHLVVEGLENLEIGQVAYAIPIHICPTVSKYKKVLVIRKNKMVDSWDIVARDHQLKI
jgi:D-serine deaminase-like pyridoxal phosphate-dependent protein